MNFSAPKDTPARPAATARSQILTLLEERDAWCSGEAIAGQLGISRAAVGKHVACLRADDHAIAAATRRGYRLLARRDLLDGAALAASLPTRIFGKTAWHILEETTSTNHDAVRLANEGCAEGCVIVAERQTQGRGRKGHVWRSLPRGLQFSVLLRPEACSWNAALLTGLAALAVARAVREVTGLTPCVKPPNDVHIGGRKLAGVLVETGLRGDEPDWAVLGIGCNVNALPEDFPPEERLEDGRPRFTSLLEETGRFVSRPALLAVMLEHLEKAYVGMRSGEVRDADPAAL